MPGLAGAGNGVELPDLLACFGIISSQETANSQLPAGGPDNDFVFDDQRRQGHRIALGVVEDRDVPFLRAGRSVERDQAHVESGEEERVIENRHSAVDAPTAGNDLIGQVMLVDPKHAAGPGVQSEDVVGRLGDVHHAVDDQRGGFELFKRAGLEDPVHLELLDILRRDAVERTVVDAVVAAVVGQPVLGLFGGVEEAFVGDLRLDGRPRNLQAQKREEQH